MLGAALALLLLSIHLAAGGARKSAAAKAYRTRANWLGAADRTRRGFDSATTDAELCVGLDDSTELCVAVGGQQLTLGAARPAAPIVFAALVAAETRWITLSSGAVAPGLETRWAPAPIAVPQLPPGLALDPEMLASMREKTQGPSSISVVFMCSEGGAAAPPTVLWRGEQITAAMFAMPVWMQRMTQQSGGGFVAARRLPPGNELNEIVVHIAVGWVCSAEFQPVARWWQQYAGLTRLRPTGGGGDSAVGSAFNTDSDAADDIELLYGEITVEGTATLLTEIGLGPDDTLYDLGSGAGRLVAQAALMSGGRAVGIEIDPARHAIAAESVAAATAAGVLTSAIAARISFVEGDAFRPNGFADATAVYMLSTAFGHGTFNRFVLAVAAAANLRWIISSKAIPADLLGTHNAKRGHQQIALHTNVVVPTSWNPACTVSIYKVTPAPDTSRPPSSPPRQQGGLHEQQGGLNDAPPATRQQQPHEQAARDQATPESVRSPQDTRRRERQRIKDAARQKRRADL